jgi:hypothetical protein
MSQINSKQQVFLIAKFEFRGTLNALIDRQRVRHLRAFYTLNSHAEGTAHRVIVCRDHG